MNAFDAMMDNVNEWMINQLGYENAVRIQEALTWISGILLGIIIAVFFLCRHLLKVRIDYDLKSPTMLKVNSNNSKWIILNPRTTTHVIEAIYISVIWRMKKGNSKENYFDVEHEPHSLKRVRKILFTLLTIALIVIIIGFAFALDIVDR
jgi:hypothetical protein